MKEKKIQIRCPTCGKTIVADQSAPWRPFCSERCRLIDLGDWLDETHRIPDRTPVEGERPDGDE